MPSIAPRLPFLIRLAGIARVVTVSGPSSASRNEGSATILRPYTASTAIWVLIASVFLLDLLTPADDVSVCFAYLIPIFVKSFEPRLRRYFTHPLPLFSIAGW